MYLGECACSVAAPPSLPWPLSGCSCCGHGAGRSRALGPAEVPAGGGRCLPPFTPPELCKASVSTRSQKESSALMLYNVFFFQVIFLFFPSFSLTLSILFLFFFFILAVPLSSCAVTAWTRASVALVGLWDGSAFPFPARRWVRAAAGCSWQPLPAGSGAAPAAA